MNFIAVIPAAAAANPPKLLVITYANALAISPFPSMLTTSTENVENVVNEPQNPTPRRSFDRGDKPKAGGRGGIAGAETAEDIFSDGATTGDAKIPPRMKDPNTLIPAVCHPVNEERFFGSLAICSAATFPIWCRQSAPHIAPAPTATASVTKGAGKKPVIFLQE